MVQKGVQKRVGRRRTKWGGILLAFAMAFGATFGVLGTTQSTKALPGDPANWTVENESGLTVTVVSVMQGEVELVPTWSEYIYNDDLGGFGNYYFSVANNTDEVRLGVLVDGMAEEKTYTIFDDHELTSENNGQVVYENVKPHVYSYSMSDGVDCWMEQGEEHCSYTPLANEYVISASLHDESWNDWVSKNLVVRPERVGSSNIEIMSVQQNGEDVFLDTVGRQVTNWEDLQNTPQTINEYRIDDYNTPIEVTFKLKNLEVGERYAFDAGDYESFTAMDTEETFTREFRLNYVKKHISESIYFYGSGDGGGEDVDLYFRVADANFVPLGDIVVDEISQGGNEVVPEEDTTGTPREYTFNVNDVQPINVSLHATRATAEMDYYIIYSSGYGGGSSLHSEEPLAVTGEELENGVVLVIPSGYGLSEDSPFSLNIYVNTTGSNYDYGSQKVIYENYGANQNTSDRFLFNFYEDAELPRFGARIGYRDSDEEIYDVINAKYHDEEHPLYIRIEGERYDDETEYEIHGRVATEDGEYFTMTFVATGAELNEGKTFVVNGLTLRLPEFDPDAETSGYELAYEFSLEINGLEQRGVLYYMYDGYIYTVMTYAGGKVVGSANPGEGYGDMYVRSSETTVRRSSLDGSRSAILHYLGNGFDEDLNYEYEIYYNSDAGENWWSAPAGEMVEDGILSGRYLNGEGFTVEVEVPDNASESSMYSLVITRNGGLVIVVKDFLRFTDDPLIESFAFRTDDDVFMQTGVQDYRLARGAEATVTLTGAGFDDASEYRVWVSYSSNGYIEDEYGGYWDMVDLTQLDDDVVVTGAELNDGFDYTLAYDEVLDTVNDVEIIFNVSDKDHEKPDLYDWSDDGVYAGHIIYINYVAEEDVFHGRGFHIDEDTSEIIDVSQPEGIPIDNRAGSEAGVHTEGDTLVLVAQKPCMVVGVINGEYTLIGAETMRDDDGVMTNTYDVAGFDEIVVALKGNLYDADQLINLLDANVIYRSLLNHDAPAYQPLSPLEAALADLNGDHLINLLDANVVYRSLLNHDAPAYEAITWD